MDKAKLKEFADWLDKCISEYKDEHHPEPKPEPRVDAEVQLDDLIYRLPRPIPVRACDVCGTACGAEVCDACNRDATTFRIDVNTAQGRYLYGEHIENPDLDGYEHAYTDAKNAYLRRIAKRKEAR